MGTRERQEREREIVRRAIVDAARELFVAEGYGLTMRAGLIDEYAVVTHPVLVGGGRPFFTALDNWVDLTLVETRAFPGGVTLARYETRR